MKVKTSLRKRKWHEKKVQIVTRWNKSHTKKRKYLVARGRKKNWRTLCGWARL